MKRILFSQLCPFTYKLAIQKGIWKRRLQDLFAREKFSKQNKEVKLLKKIYSHQSLIRRKLGNVDATLQDNKAVNLGLATPKVTHTLIKPGEVFSFWKLVGPCRRREGYRTGLTIAQGKPSEGVGGGMCQFTNLIHWMVLHTDLEIIEHHHHDRFDLFPDFNRQIPFGTGTSIMYNYLDYRFKNTTDRTYQLITYTTPTHLCGQIRADKPQPYSYHIECVDEYFTKEADGVYRNGKVYRKKIDKQTGNVVENLLIRENHAKVMYDTTNLEVREG